MAERAEGTILVDAAPARVLAAIADVESYPEWAGVQSVEVRARDRRGRAIEVDMRVEVMGFTASYTLAYRYAPRDRGVSWTTTRAEGAVRDVTGEYVLEEEGGATRVTYRLSVEPAVPVPGFLRRQGERRALRAGLEGLKRRVEEG